MLEFLRARKRIIGIMAPMLLGLILMLICMANLRQPVSFDESRMAFMTRSDFSAAYELSGEDANPPLYVFALKTWSHFFGHTDFAMRMLSVLLGAVAVMVTYVWLRREHSLAAAIIGAGLLSVSPALVWSGQEMQLFAMLVTVSIIATYILQIAICRGDYWWIIYAVSLALIFWASYVGLVVWILHAIYLFIKYRHTINKRYVTFSFIAAFALTLPGLGDFFRAIIRSESYGSWVLAIVILCASFLTIIAGIAVAKLFSRRRIFAFCALVVLIIISFCGISSVSAKKDQLANKQLFESITVFDHESHLPIVCANPRLYMDLSFYASSKHPVYYDDENAEYNQRLYILRDTRIGRFEAAGIETFWYVTTMDQETGEPSTQYPNGDWSVAEYSLIHLDNFSETYAIVKMVKE